jgi:hypothetical protein
MVQRMSDDYSWLQVLGGLIAVILKRVARAVERGVGIEVREIETNPGAIPPPTAFTAFNHLSSSRGNTGR